MKPQKIYIGIILTALLSIAYVAYAGVEKNSSTFATEFHQTGLEAQSKAIEDMKLREKLLKTPTCDEPLLVTIADTKFALPRTGLTIIDASGQRHEYLDHQCEIKHLDGIRNFNYPNAGIADLRYNDYKSQYNQDKALIEDGRASGNSKLLANGTELITKGYLYIYILPLEVRASADKEPVVFNCPTSGGNPGDVSQSSSCTTQYLYKKNLQLGYRFFRMDYPSNGHIQADKDTRKRFESWIIKGN